MKRTLMGMIVVWSLFFCGRSFSQAKISDGVVKIAVLTDMSGLYTDIGGPGSVAAAQIAIDEFGGKVLGKPIQLFSADHQNKGDVVANRAREGFNAQQVELVVDVPNSSVALAGSKIADEKNRLFMV